MYPTLNVKSLSLISKVHSHLVIATQIFDTRGFPKVDHSDIDARIVLEQINSAKKATSNRTWTLEPVYTAHFLCLMPYHCARSHCLKDWDFNDPYIAITCQVFLFSPSVFGQHVDTLALALTETFWTQIERNTEFLYHFECIYFSCQRNRRSHQTYIKEIYIFLKTMSQRSKTNRQNHIQYMKDTDSGFIL